jgi:hypothetical protein
LKVRTVASDAAVGASGAPLLLLLPLTRAPLDPGSGMPPPSARLKEVSDSPDYYIAVVEGEPGPHSLGRRL